MTRGMRMTSYTGSVCRGFWGFEKSQWVESLPGKKKVDFRGSSWPDEFVHYGRCKNSQHRRIVSLSPYVEKPFNSKVIKSFVPELRSRKCFLCFRIPMLSIYELWTFYVHFTYSCIAMEQRNQKRWALWI